MASRSHELRLDMPVIKKDYVLKCVPNKIRLNKLMYDSITTDEEFLNQATKSHKLIMMNENTIPYQFYHGRKMPRMDLASSHEEADMIVTKHAILCGLEPNSRVECITEDTDIFVAVCHFYQDRKLENPMIMQSPKRNRDTYDIKASVNENQEVMPKILAIHGLSGNDTVCSPHNIGKTIALKAGKKNSFVKIGLIDSTTAEIMEEGTKFMTSCYNNPTCKTMTECRQKAWAQKTGKSGSAPKLATLPSTTEGFLMNVLRAHLQICNWNYAMEIDPPELNPADLGFEADHTNKVLIPKALPDGVKAAPDEILEKLRCGCSSEQPCKTTHCKCHKRGRPCTIFCGCSASEICCNPHKKQINDDDSENDSDDEDENAT